MSHKFFTEHRPKDFLSYRRDDLKSTIHAGNHHAHSVPDRRQSGPVTPQTVGACVRVVGLAPSERQAQRNELSGCAFGTRTSRHAHVQVKNLASHALSLATKRLAKDWRERYGLEPVLVETFVKHGRFTGVSYRAANWSHVGLTKGRGRQDQANQFFEEAEWKALMAYKTQNPIPPETPPTLREAVHMVASLGGFLGPRAMANREP